tara:strand:+ start:518 stop:931 length:414 start_codon:yes stop_codon:yes gene_type:complete
LKKIVTLNLYPPPKRKVRPVIYFHIYVNKNKKMKIQYGGETVDLYSGRPFRAAEGTWGRRYPVSYVRWIDASTNAKRRLFWEAVLIAKLKPKQQNWKTYQRRVDIYHEERERKKNRKRYMTRPLKDFIKNYEEERKI